MVILPIYSEGSAMSKCLHAFVFFFEGAIDIEVRHLVSSWGLNWWFFYHIFVQGATMLSITGSLGTETKQISRYDFYLYASNWIYVWRLVQQITITQECIPVGCVLPGQLNVRWSPWQRPPWTDTPLVDRRTPVKILPCPKLHLCQIINLRTCM